MKTIIIVLLSSIIILIFVYCNEKNRKLPSYSKIDFSRSNGWNFFFSVSIDSMGRFYLETINGFDEGKYFTSKLPDSTWNVINSLVNSIQQQKYDSIYERRCADCSAYKAVIYGTERKYSIRVLDKSGTLYDSLENLMINISNSKSLIPIDTTMKFESQDFIPPLTHDDVKFIPPDEIK